MSSVLSSKALLVTLSISQWSARKFDKRETAELALKHTTSEQVARVNKALLPAAETLVAVHKMTNAIRWDYYRNSLPWGQEGVNIIKADQYMDFASKMRDHMYNWRQLVQSFIAAYPQLREEARVALNGMYREEDYPHPDDLARRFSIDVAFLPVPDASDWRVSVGDLEMDELRAQISAQVEKGQGVAMRDAWRQVYEVVQKAHERLSNPDTVFRDSLVENAKSLCRLLPSLNLTDDPNLESVRRAIEGSLCKHEPATLREAPDVREQVSKKLAGIMDKMGAFYGPA